MNPQILQDIYILVRLRGTLWFMMCLAVTGLVALMSLTAIGSAAQSPETSIAGSRKGDMEETGGLERKGPEKAVPIHQRK